MRKFLVLLVLAFSLFSFRCPCNCFSIVVGKKASYNGAVLFGHNEDDLGDDILRLWKIPEKRYNEEFKLLNGGKERAGESFSLVWIELKKQKVADTFLNQYGVGVASDACPSKIKGSKKGIIYFLRRLVAERAKSAREGVKIAGQLIEKHEYPQGRTLIIVDPNEGWLLHVIGGKHWLAWRVPDDAVATIPNFYTLKNLDIKNNKNVLSSEDIKKFARSEGLYNFSRDGKFNFAKVFSAEEAYKSEYNVNRQWRAIELLSGRKWPRKVGLPPYFKPSRKLSPQDLFRVLRDHYEGTELDLSNGYRNGSPNMSRKRPICYKTTKYSFVMELRSKLPGDIGNLIWFSPSRPDESPYIPIYFGIKQFKDPGMDNIPKVHSEILRRHFYPPPILRLKLSELFYYPFRVLASSVELNYIKRISLVRTKWDEVEHSFFSLQPYVENTAINIYRGKGEKEADNFLTDYVLGIMERVRLEAIRLIKYLSSFEEDKNREPEQNHISQN